MLCITEVSPPKAPDGRSILIDATTATQFRTFRHGIVDDKHADDNLTGSTIIFAPNLGCGTVFSGQENSIMYNYSLAQSSPVLRCLMPERITAQKVSPCGNYLALGGVSGAVYFISLITGEMLWMRRGHVRSVTCLAFSQPSSSSASSATHEQSAFLASSSIDTTCRIIRLGAPVEDPSSVVTMTGHSLAVTACSFMKYANRLVSVSKDRTCRISDALSGTVLKVFTAAVGLTSVAIGPCDAVVACGGSNGSISFFKQLDNTIVGEQITALSSSSSAGGKNLNSASKITSLSSRASKTVSVNSLMKETGANVFDLAASNSTSNNNNSSSSTTTNQNNTDICKVVGPFTGGPQSPIIFLGDLNLQKPASDVQQQPANSLFTLGDISSSGSQHEQPVLVVVSRDGFMQTYSWSSLSFVKDIQRTKKGIAAACLVPPKFIKYASSTIADKPLIQKSALQLKKAPVSSAGARVFLMKPLWSVGQGKNSNNNNNNSTNSKEQSCVVTEQSSLLTENNNNVGRSTPSSTLFYRIRQRDQTSEQEDSILERNSEWLKQISVGIMKEKEQELLVQANELFASKQ